MSLTAIAIHDAQQWDSLLAGLPAPHLLQSWRWGELKSTFGWDPQRLVWQDARGEVRAAAQILARSVPFPGGSLTVLYAPKGPILDWSDAHVRFAVLSDLEASAGRKGVVFLKIDPDLPRGIGEPGEPDFHDHPQGLQTESQLEQRGWRRSAEAIQFRNTLVIDLRPSQDEILAEMKQKTRYNVRLARRKGVYVRQGGLGDLDLLYAMYAETSLRDGFVIRSRDYYEQAWGAFIQADLAQPFVAEVDSEPVAGLIAYRFGPTAWYLYGMSTEKHREKMPSYRLQWEAMCWAKAKGCERYDLWGIPDRFDESDPMWGVYRFKSGFGGQVILSIGPWDHTARPGMYWLYTSMLPRLLSLMRIRGRRQTRAELEA